MLLLPDYVACYGFKRLFQRIYWIPGNSHCLCHGSAALFVRKAWSVPGINARPAPGWETMGCGDANSAAPATPELGTVLFCSRLNSLFCTFPTGGSRARLHHRQRFCGSMLLFCHTVRTRMHPLWYNHACTMHSWLLEQIASIALAVITTRDEAPCSHASVIVLPSRPRDTGCLARSLCLRATAAAASICTTA